MLLNPDTYLIVLHGSEIDEEDFLSGLFSELPPDDKQIPVSFAPFSGPSLKEINSPEFSKLRRELPKGSIIVAIHREDDGDTPAGDYKVVVIDTEDLLPTMQFSLKGKHLREVAARIGEYVF